MTAAASGRSVFLSSSAALVLAGACGLLLPASASAQALSAEEAAALRAEIAALKAQVARMEARLDAATAPAPAQPAEQTASAPVVARGTEPLEIDWRSAPRIAQGGWRFEPIGRLQFDAAYVGRPPGSEDRGFGFSNEARRIRLGGEGAMPGGFGYKLEVELSDNAVDLVDTFITYRTGAVEFTAGNHNSYQSLDELIGDTTGAFMERAAFTDAFGFERRLGISAEYRAGALLAQGGIFTDSVSSLENAVDGPGGGDENDSFGLDGRLVLAPKLGDLQLHFGGSAHWRDYNRLSESPVRLRQRPYVHTSNSRLLDTGDIPASGERHYGLEIAGVRGRLHFAGEAHWFGLDRLDGPDPTFFGGYAEVGYFLTPGDTRPYRDGIFQRPEPVDPVGAGGIGSVLVSLRYDYLSLDDRGIVGGQQNGYIGSLIWTPVPYLRFNLNYAMLDYRNAAIPSTRGRDYALDVLAMRMEFDY